MTDSLAGTVFVRHHAPLTIHTYMSPEDGELVCSQVIETPGCLVVIDAQLLLAYAHELRSYVNSLGKPVERVIITHSHPDHWMGLEVFSDCPIYALAEVISELEATADWWLNLKATEVGDGVSHTKVLPTHELTPGSHDIGGAELVVHRIAGGEATVTAMLELPGPRLLLAQDVVYNGVHLFVGELHGPDRTVRCFAGWEDTLRELAARDFAGVLPGHGEPADRRVISAQLEYLAAAREVAGTATGAEDYRARMLAAFPSHRVPEMIDFSVMMLFPEVPIVRGG